MVVSRLVGLVRRDLDKLIACNVAFFGTFVAVSLYVSFFAPELHSYVMEIMAQAMRTDPLLSAAARAYFIKKNPLEALVITFLVNFFVGSLVTIILPGIALPSVPVALLRAALWGVLFPVGMGDRFCLALPTLVAEGEGYVLSMVPGLNLSLALLNPKSYGTSSRREALATVMREIPFYALLIAIVLIAAAAIEVSTVFLSMK